MLPHPEIVLATYNPGKIKEIENYLRPRHPQILFRRLLEMNVPWVAEEDGKSFMENAEKKAKAYSAATGLPCLADDSGLEVDFLRGAPGIRSSCFAGPNATDTENIQKLLQEMRDAPPLQRNARFVCAMVLARPTGEVFRSVGKLAGRIVYQPVGKEGFGYDPVFWVDELGKTLAEIPPEQKNQISHRAKALQNLTCQAYDSDAAHPK